MEKFLLHYLVADLIIKEYEDQAEETMFPLEQFFPLKKVRTLKFNSITGANGLPIVLEPAAIGDAPNARQRKSFETNPEKLFYFTNSYILDTETLLELDSLKSLPVNDSRVVDIIEEIYDDQYNLIEGGRATDEKLRTQLMQTLSISGKKNGANYTINYNAEPEQIEVLAKPWSDPSADIIGDIERHKELASNRKNAITPNAMMCSSKIITYIKKNTAIQNLIKSTANLTGLVLTKKKIVEFFEEQLEITLLFNDTKHTNDNGDSIKFWDETRVTLFYASKNVGQTVHGPTPFSLIKSNESVQVESIDNGAYFLKTENITRPSVNRETAIDTTCAISGENLASVQIIEVA